MTVELAILTVTSGRSS